MEASMVLARIMGPTFVVAALHLFLYRKHVQKVMDELMSSEAGMFYGAYAALVMGLIVVTFHNMWEGDYQILITLIGWIAVIKGVLLMLWPRAAKNVIVYFQKSDGMIALGGLISLVIGGYLSYAGYFMA